ncbi:MAG: FAD-binding protein [SAR324 cluster bacterium]|nr:FAD-binding protein [SAR324 cluster bacterium]
MNHENSTLATRLKKELKGDVLFDAFSRGLYSTDASIYQIEPLGVVVPKSDTDVVAAIRIAAEEGVSVLPRGGGTSQCGQTVGESLVIDFSKYLKKVIELNPEKRTVAVQPGIVLDQLNQILKPHGLFFPVDVSTASRATIGGMTGNNSCGARSIRYGNMIHNVRAIEALMEDGELCRFSQVPGNLEEINGSPRYRRLIGQLRGIAEREREELERRFPKLLRRVGGYNLDSLSSAGHNMAHMLVGSEGTLSTFTRIELEIHPIPKHKVLGVCHFPTFYQAMDAAQHIVKLDPAAVELVDRTMIELARKISLYQPTVDRVIQGRPEAILLVEFAGDDFDPQVTKLQELKQLMGDLGFADSVVEATDASYQSDIWEVRKAGLNIMMSMKGDGKPVSFIEDCAVALEDLAEYTDRLTQVFTKYGTTGTWYAHASVGCLHVRPILNMKEGEDVRKMRAIAEEAFEMVREYKGSHSGEHGDGLTRSEFHEKMFGTRIKQAFEEVKRAFDPQNLFNPGKIVNAGRLDDRSLFRYKPDYRAQSLETALDWSEWNGFAGAVEMCNNNGACRKSGPGVMCPSYRASGDERHLTRGRANSLRLAITGQLGKDAFVSEEMHQVMDLCVSCKACKKECPVGVDVARMKIEFLHQYQKQHGLPLKDRLLAYLPRYAHLAARMAPLANLRDTIPGMAQLSDQFLGLSVHRRLPQWRTDFFSGSEQKETDLNKNRGREIVLLVDTFNTWFEPENARAALKVLKAAGYRVHIPQASKERYRPLCCGRTFLTSGLVEEAKKEAIRMLETLAPFLEKEMPVVGLEPACLLALRDEFQAILPGGETDRLARHAVLFEEFLAKELASGDLQLPLKALAQKKALLHGHCHQKAFDAMSAVEKILSLVPELEVGTVESSCCGMAGSFGFDSEHFKFSMKMGEMSLLPAVRSAAGDTLIVADGTSCRQQIKDGAQRQAIHVARVLEMALEF